MQTKRKTFKVYLEDAKERQTSHWDLDYMTSAELAAALGSGRGRKSQKPALESGGLRSFYAFIKRIFSVPLARRA